MRVLIIEDEKPAARRLCKLVADCCPQANIVETLDSVEASVAWLNSFESPDLIFMDIQLADGLSFDIFNHSEIESPIIFTTAYDQYTLKAFKVNSIDYLLKPIDKEELTLAIDKYHKVFNKTQVYDKTAIRELLQSINGKSYKERFLVKMGQQLSYVATTDIAYFSSEDGFVHVRDRNNKRHIIDYTLDQLEGILDPDNFFRINRKIITRLDSIRKIHTYFNSRLKLELHPTTELEVIVSRDRVGDFKLWLDK